MRALASVLFAAWAGALVIPSQEVLESNVFQQVEPKDRAVVNWLESARNTIEEAGETVAGGLKEAVGDVHETLSSLDVPDWLEQARESADWLMEEAIQMENPFAGAFRYDFGFSEEEGDMEVEACVEHDRREHGVGHGKHEGNYGHGGDHDHHGGHGRHGRHGRHGGHGEPDMTLLQLISKSPVHTKLLNFLKDDEEIMEFLNSTEHNYTIFAPTDKAIVKFEEARDYEKPPKEEIHKILQYHVAPEIYPVRRILSLLSLPTILKPKLLGDEGQRVHIGLDLTGVKINFYSKVVKANVFGTNGVLHAVDSVIIPPPDMGAILRLLPSTYSTLANAFITTGLGDELKDVDHGRTLFAPTNSAFELLGAGANAFLFSEKGKKYLVALLKYHVSPDVLLYSDKLVKTGGEEEAETFPKGHYHADVETLVKGHQLSVDIGRFGRLLDFVVNRYSRVVVPDGAAADGVIHALASVILPPKKLGGLLEMADGEVDVQSLMERLEPLVD